MEFHSLFKNIFDFSNLFSFRIIKQSVIDDIDRTIKEFINKEKVVGLAIGISLDGQVILKKGYGYQNREQNIKVDVDHSLFRWASISKTLTAIIALKMNSEGLLNLDKPVETWIKEFKISNRIVKHCTRGQPFIRRNDEIHGCLGSYVEYELSEQEVEEMIKITPSLLLSHQSGICEYTNTPYQSYPYDEEMKNPSLYNKNFDYFLQYFMHRPLIALPGEEYNYSSMNFNLLGKILEESIGLSYLDLVNKYIRRNDHKKYPTLLPDYEKHKHLYPNRCVGYKKGKRTEDTDVSFKLPGGGFFSNLTDALDYCINLNSTMSNYEKFLGWSKNHHGSNYGLGFMIWKHDDNEYSVGHLGGQQKASTFMKYYPKRRICFVGLSNSEDFPQRKLRDSIHKKLLKL